MMRQKLAGDIQQVMPGNLLLRMISMLESLCGLVLIILVNQRHGMELEQEVQVVRELNLNHHILELLILRDL